MPGVRPGRILLAEDDPHDVELVFEALRRHQLANKVDVVNDGEQALDYLHRRNAYADRSGEHPLVIFLDLKMPRVSGMEVLKQVKESPQLRMIPTVVLTSSREERDVLDSYRLGTNAFVVKPIGFHEFVGAVSDLAAFWAIVNEPPPGVVPSGPG